MSDKDFLKGIEPAPRRGDAEWARAQERATQAGALQAVDAEAIEAQLHEVFVGQGLRGLMTLCRRLLTERALAATQPNAAPGAKQRCVVGSKCDTCTCAEDPQAASLSNAVCEQQSEGMSLAPGAAEIMGNALRNGHRNTRNTPRGHS